MPIQRIHRERKFVQTFKTCLPITWQKEIPITIVIWTFHRPTHHVLWLECLNTLPFCTTFFHLQTSINNSKHLKKLLDSNIYHHNGMFTLGGSPKKLRLKVKLRLS
jgi:hypothetical protein